jgi:hypothetical protein
MTSNNIYNKYKMGPQLNPSFYDSIKKVFNNFLNVFR